MATNKQRPGYTPGFSTHVDIRFLLSLRDVVQRSVWDGRQGESERGSPNQGGMASRGEGLAEALTARGPSRGAPIRGNKPVGKRGQQGEVAAKEGQHDEGR